MKLDELRELREAATPGPWYSGRLSTYGRVVAAVPNPGPYDRQTVARNLTEADQTLIALAPDLARLVCELGEALEFAVNKWWDTPIGEYRAELDKARAVLASLAELGERK